MAIPSDDSGYIRFIDTAAAGGAGEAIPCQDPCPPARGPVRARGSAAAGGIKGQRLTPEGRADLLAAFDFGPSRTLQQDIEFGVLQIVDIALKAISPAVNDPTTAISCVDQLEPHHDSLRLAGTA